MINTPTTKSPERAGLIWEILCGGALAALFVRLAQVSWRTWPDLLVDFGHELYVPWRLSLGDVLYRDMAFSMGPLSQYGNALLFRLFGVSLDTLIGANLVLLSAILALLVWLFRRSGTRASATLMGMFFLAVFAFSQYRQIGNYNYVCPYRHEMTHGLALGLMNLLCLTKFGETRHTRWLVASGLCLGLVALTKAELVLPAVLTTAAAISIFAWGGQRVVRPAAAGTAVVCATALGPIAIALFGLAMSLGWQGAWKGIVANYALALDPSLTARSAFYRSLAGLDYPVENAMTMLLSAAVVLGAAALGVLAEMLCARFSRSKVWIGTVGVAAIAGGVIFVPPPLWFSLPAALPLLLPAVIAIHIRPAVREAGRPGAAAPLCLTAIYGLGLLPKMLLQAQWTHYGFVLAMPATLVLVHLAIHSIPAWLTRRIGSGSTFRALSVGLLTACAVLMAARWERIDLHKTLLVGQAGDCLYVDPNNDERSGPAVRTLKYLEQAMQPDETLVVIPDGAMLNYLLRKRNPTPFLMFNPWEFDAQGGEDVVCDSLIRSAPDYMVVLTMDMTIFGRGNFGDPQYGARISDFLKQNYDVVDGHNVMSPYTSREFGSLVYKRRSQ